MAHPVMSACHRTEIESTLFSQSAELLKATAPGRTDRPDRYSKHAAYLVVRRPRVAEELGQQRLASWWKPLEDGLHRLVPLAVQQPVKGIDGAVIGPSLFIRLQAKIDPPALGHDAQAFASGGRDQPAALPFRVLDAVDVLRQPQPGRLRDVTQVAVADVQRPQRGGQEPEEPVDEA